jgi:hypothetical protein
MTLSKVTSHIAEMLDRRLEEFRDKARFSAMLSLLGQQVQDLEDSLYQLLVETSLDVAVGAALDGIGDIVGEERSGRSDSAYRIAIRTRIILNQSEGTPENIIALALAISGETNAQLTEYFPASFEIRILDALPDGTDPARIAAVVRSGKPAGVRAITILHADPPFQYDTGTGFDEGKYAVAAV